jgi:MGT family glycosyltransferase
MATIGVVHTPAQGHIRPAMAVARALAARGHRVVSWVPQGWESRVHDDHVHVRTLPDPGHMNPEEPPSVLLDLAAGLLRTATDLTGPLVTGLGETGTDLVLHDSMAPWGRAAAEAMGLPVVSCTSTFALSRRPPHLRDVPSLLPAVLAGPSSLVGYSRARAGARRAGLDLGGPVDLLSNPGDLTLVCTSQELQPDAGAFGTTHAFVGPLLDERFEPEPALDDIGDDRPLVYVALGTLRNDRAAFYRACLQAATDQPWAVVISIGRRVDPGTLGPVPSNVVLSPAVAQRAVLARASVFLTHCGMNSVHEALLAGVPMVAFPQSGDQFLVASRVEALGAARRLRRPSSAAIRERVSSVLTDASTARRARELGRGLRATGGTALAVDRIEQLLAR